MSEFSTNDVAEDLGIAMRVCGEAGLGSHAIFVEDAEGAVVLVAGVEVTGEGEGVVGVEPAVVSVAAGRGRVGDNFGVGEEGGHGFLHCGCHAVGRGDGWGSVMWMGILGGCRHWIWFVSLRRQDWIIWCSSTTYIHFGPLLVEAA